MVQKVLTASPRLNFLAPAWSWGRRARLGFPLGTFFFFRLWTLVWAHLAWAWLPVQTKPAQYYGLAPLDRTMLGWLWAPWQRWDTNWYAKIAEQGYAANDQSLAFFPLFPLLMKILASAFGSSVAAGVVVASLAALVSFILLYHFTREQWGEPTARLTLLYMAAFPTAFFLFAAYPESLFLTFVLGAFLCVQGRRWSWGCGLGALAALTRPQGVLIVIPLALEFFLQYRRKEISLGSGLNLFVVAAGALTYFIYLAVRFQNPFIWFGMQGAWHRASMPWEPLASALNLIMTSGRWIVAAINLQDAGCALLFLGLGIWSFFRLSPVLAIYTLVIVLPSLFALTTYSENQPLASMARYVVVAFPAFLLLGRLRSSVLSRLLLGFSFLLQTLWLMLFAAWIFVG